MCVDKPDSVLTNIWCVSFFSGLPCVGYYFSMCARFMFTWYIRTSCVESLCGDIDNLTIR